MTVVLDDTDQVSEGKSLQEEFKSHAILDSIQEGLIIVRADQFLFVNKKFSDLLDWSVEELLGSNWFDFIHKDFRDVLQKELQRISQGETQDQPIESKIVRADGDTRDVLLSIAQTNEYPGGPAEICSVLDITASKRAEEWLRKSQKFDAIGRLSGGISHDFNNLLAVIYGNLVLLRDDLAGGGKLDRAEAIDMVESALASATRGSALIKQLLAFSRKQSLAPETVDIDEIVSDMASLLKRALGPEIKLIVQLRDGDRWMAKVDPGQLESAVLNLALNARDAMAGRGILTIETMEISIDDEQSLVQGSVTPGEYVMLCVSDTGCGMEPEIVERSFEPFFTTKGPDKGTGLGLSMVYGFAQQSGGSAEVYSEPGNGTAVKIYIPKARSKVNRKTPKLKVNRKTPKLLNAHLNRQGVTVLVVEDDKGVLNTTIKILRRLGYDLIEARDGLEALDILQSINKIDILFTDVLMPNGMNGLELAEIARSLDPNLRILLTSGHANDDSTDCSTDGAFAFLPKPYKPDKLSHELTKLLERGVEVS